MTSNIKVRYAKKQDLQAVYALVKALAVFEKEPDAVTSTMEEYEEAFESGLIGIKVAESGDEIMGMALYYDTFSTWKGKMLFLEDFIVEEQYRSLGIGKLLFDAVLEEAHHRQCNMMKWQVLEWNTRAIKFYDKYNCKMDPEWVDCKLYFK